ncbi:DUF1835 domain-containing protein [Maribacter sp. 2307ULW6-5]|uniref:DUF1835 domain-containing protein n=1 Tax=Maribacter sp. 2307ULW6-5 TaxID=3386275 RepID=UPI0039BD1A66
MSSLLHITNGDRFTERLSTLELKGDIITWREMLCEGKTLTTVGSESFWKTRFDFLNKNYKVSKSWFIEKTLKEYRSLCNHKQQDQIVLWFDHDLFCQVNLLAVISWLLANRKYAQISLVSSGLDPKTKTIRELTSLTDDELREMYAHRVMLNQDDIEFADYVWQLYCSNNPIRLEHLTDFKDYNFSFLGAAIARHLRRFPTISNGLNEMENNILAVAAERQHKNKAALVGSLLQQQGNLGFADTQYERAIGRLKPLFTGLNPVRLSRKGKAILEESNNYYSALQDNEVYLGGALKYSFLYNTESNRILKL